MFFKQELRKEMLSKRKALTTTQVEAGGLQLLERLQNGDHLEDVNTAFVYVSGKNEVSTFPLISHLQALGVQVCVPKTFGQGYMEAWKIQNLQKDLQPGAFGILEPVTACPVAVAQIDLVIVPGVAFDQKGNRIGYGAGYYDRFFVQSDLNKHVRKIGVCYDFQLVDAIEAAATDIPMDKIITVLGENV